MFLQAPVEVPQHLGISLLVEGAQIRHPRSSRAKTFIRSYYGSLHKSRRILQPHTHPSGKENQCEEEEEKRTWLPVPTRKVTMERSLTLQPLMAKRCPRPALPSSLGPLPKPSHYHHLHTSHTCTHHTQVHAEPTHTHRTQRRLLSLNRVEPSLEIICRQHGVSHKSWYHQNSHTLSTCLTQSYAHTSTSHCLTGKTQRGTETKDTWKSINQPTTH